jgi:hypothetical protein
MQPPPSPGFSLGSYRSRGHPPRYAKTQPSAQGTPTSPADLPAQRLPTQVPTAELEPALLPGSAMPAGGQALAGGSPTGQTSPGCPRQSPPCPGREGAAEARSSHARVHCQPGGCARAWSRSRRIFSLPLCDRPGCHEPPVTSSRNPARFCCAACRGAVRNVRDRERKWLCRGTLEGRTKRTIEYQAARRNRSRPRQATPADVPPRPPPQ